MRGRVVVDCCDRPEEKYKEGFTFVVVDVIRAATTAVTSVALGRECFPVPSLEAAASLSRRLDNPLLAGELGGNSPFGFHLHNSPSELEARTDLGRPMILLSSSGTPLMCGFKGAEGPYLACLRNYRVLISHLEAHHGRVALIGASTRGEFRAEDQLCCARIAEGLIRRGYRVEDEKTSRLVGRWRDSSVEDLRDGRSAAYLRESGQVRDLEFILDHINDLNCICRVSNGQVVEEAAVPIAAALVG